VNAFGSFLAIMAINAAVVGVSVVIYGVRKAIILRNRNLQNDDKSGEISEIKELMFRNVFFFLYVIFLSTCAQTSRVFPIACQKLCRDEKEEICLQYTRADYTIKCHGTKYNYWLIVAYISTPYIMALPVSSFIFLWRKQRVMVANMDVDELRGPGSGMEIISGLRFLFENYEHRSWYWELMETSCKVILTSRLILVGEESRSYIGLAWVIAGMYEMMFSWIIPIRDLTENRLMATSVALPSMDAVSCKILIFRANTLVIGLLVGKIIKTESNRSFAGRPYVHTIYSERGWAMEYIL